MFRAFTKIPLPALMFIPIHTAAEDGDDMEVRRLLTSGSNFKGNNNEHSVPAMHFAAGFGYVNIMAILKQHQADVMAIDHNGSTALHWAAVTNMKEACVWLLTQPEMNIEHVDVLGQTAMQVAASDGNVSIMATLKHHQADVNATDSGGRTALHWSAMMNKKEACVWLLDQPETNIAAADDSGRTPADLAEKLHHTELADWLRAYPADLATADVADAHGAAADVDYNILAFLLVCNSLLSLLLTRRHRWFRNIWKPDSHTHHPKGSTPGAGNAAATSVDNDASAVARIDPASVAAMTDPISAAARTDPAPAAANNDHASAVTDMASAADRTDPASAAAKTDPASVAARIDPASATSRAGPAFAAAMTDPATAAVRTDTDFADARTDPYSVEARTNPASATATPDIATVQL
ncbi:unnamed protein product [Meganyctiphanes norvegica]|uniref:Uncharacterized protein n=1 Tax=Meganyctiphanes norvegica TaxID=48144 RepID=A0AAV2PSG7_MEGNR